MDKTRQNAFIQSINTDTDINQIQYAKKKNSNLSYLSPSLHNAFASDKPENPFRHYGNFNLKIADQIEELKTANLS